MSTRFRPDPIPSGFSVVRPDPIPQGFEVEREPSPTPADPFPKLAAGQAIEEARAVKPTASKIERTTARIDAKSAARRREVIARDIESGVAATKAERQAEKISASPALMARDEEASTARERAANPDADTWGERIRKSVAQNWAGFEKQLAGLERWGAEHTGDIVGMVSPGMAPIAKAATPLIDQATRPVVEASEKVQRAAQADIEANQYKFNGKADYYLQNIADSLIQMVPTVAAAYLTRGESVAAEVGPAGVSSANPIVRFLSKYSPRLGNVAGKFGAEVAENAVGLGALAAQQGGQKYGESRAAGRTVGQSDMDGLVFGLAEAIPEATPLGAMMKPGGKFLPRLLKTAGFEGASEIVTQAVETGYSAGILNEKMTWRDALGQMVDAGIIGFGMGGGMGAAGHAINKARGGEAGAAIRNIRDAEFDTSASEIAARAFDPSSGFRPVRARGTIEAATDEAQETPEDQASPLSRVVDLGAAKTLLAGARGKMGADTILNRNNAPQTGSMVEVMGKRWTVEDAFTDEGGEEGVTLSRDGQRQKVYFNDLADAGIRMIPIADPRSALDEAVAQAAPGVELPAPAQASPKSTPDQAGPVSGREQLKARIRRVENATGDPNAKNPESSASGIYQFTNPTFDAYYRKVYGTAPPAGVKNDPAVQERLMDAMTADNERALKKAGFETTAGNLYLAHFAGPQGAVNLLRNPNGSAATILGPRATAANKSIIEGKTGAEVAAWAAKKMGGSVASPTALGTARFADGTPAEPESDTDFDFLKPSPETTVEAQALPERQDQGLITAPALSPDEEAAKAAEISDAASLAAEPTEAQAEAGNYRKGHVRLHGLDITIETPQGATRTGTAPDGSKWSVEMPDHYGYVKRTTGADGEQVDVYIGPKPSSNMVYVVDQNDADTKEFDEHKAMLGYESQDEAIDAYHRAFSDGKGPDRVGHVTEMSVDQFKQWLSTEQTRPTKEMAAPVKSGDRFTVSDPINGEEPETVKFITRPNGDSAIAREDGQVIDVTEMIKAGFSPERAIAQAIGEDTTGSNVTRETKTTAPAGVTDSVTLEESPAIPAAESPATESTAGGTSGFDLKPIKQAAKDESVHIDAHEQGGVIYLNSVQRLDGSKAGAGAKAIRAVLAEADRLGLPVALRADNGFDETRPQADLAAYYRKFGFIQGRGTEMRREPVQAAPESPAAATQSESFDPAPHIEKLRSYISSSSGTLNDIGKIAKALDLPVAQAHAVMGAVASRPGAGFRMTKGRPAVYRTAQAGGGRTRRVLVHKAVPARYIRDAKSDKPLSAMAFVRGLGGITDPRHDLRNVGGLKNQIGVLTKAGRSVDEIGRALWEGGYFPNKDPSDPDQRPTEDETIQFLAAHSQGKRAAAPEESAPSEDEARADAHERIKTAIRESGGLLPSVISNSEREAIVDEMLATGDDAGDAVYAYFERQAVETLAAGRQETGNEDYDIPFDVGVTDETDRTDDSAQAEAARPGSESESGDARQGEETGADNGADGERLAEQTDAFGARKGDERAALERAGEGRKKATAPQKAPGSDGGLFDQAGATGDMLDPIAKAKAAVQQAMDALNGVGNETTGDSVEARKGNFDARQGDFGLSLPAETLPLWGKADTVPAKQADIFAKKPERGGKYRALGIADRIEKAGSTFLVGKQIENPYQLAELAQVYRDPRYETVRVFFMNGDDVIHATGVSARLVTEAPLMPGDNKAEFTDWLNDQMKASGADGYYLLHNHPSGDPTPSRTDQFVTTNIAKKVPGFLGHVVINSNRYATISAEGKTALFDANFGDDKLLTPSQPHPVIGAKVSMAEELAELAKRVQKPGYVTLIATDARLTVRAIVDYPESDLQRSNKAMLGALRSVMRKSGSSDLFVVARRGVVDGEAVHNGKTNGVITEAVDFEGRPPARRISARFPSPIQSAPGRFVAEPRKLYSLSGSGEEVFYSALERAVEASPTKKASAQQWAATLGKTPGVKREELIWSGIFDWLDMQTGPVDREALLGVIRDGGIKVEEVVLSGKVDNEEINLEQIDGRWVVTRANPDSENLFDIIDEGPFETYGAAASRWQEILDEDRGGGEAKFKEWASDPSNETYRELLITLPRGQGGNPDRAPSTHWDTDAVVAHARFMEKRDADGKRVLFIEEVQSDWHQKGRDEGYEAKPASQEEIAEARAEAKDAAAALDDVTDRVFEFVTGPAKLAWEGAPDNDAKRRALDYIGRVSEVGPGSLSNRFLAQNPVPGAQEEADAVHEAYNRASLRLSEASQALANKVEPKGIPEAPFKASWPALVMKRMIRYAVDNGFDRIAWTTGAEQSERYNLSQATGAIEATNNYGGGPRFKVKTYTQGGMELLAREGMAEYTGDPNWLAMSEAQLKEAFGADIAQKIVDGVNQSGSVKLEGDDLRVGGQGMRQFYDRNLVNITNDIVKKYGAKVGKVYIPRVGIFRKTQDNLIAIEQNRILRAEQGLELHRNPPSGVRYSPDETARLERVIVDARAEIDRIAMLDEAPAKPGFDITPELAEVARGGFPLFQKGESAITPENVGRIQERLKATMKRLGIDDRILLRVVDRMDVENAQGSYWRRVITIALSTPNATHTINHEAIHALRALNVFLPDEWTALVKAARADTALWASVQRRYSGRNLNTLQMEEEAVADLFGNWSVKRDAKGLVGRAFQRLTDLLKAIVAAFDKMATGNIQPGQVFRNIEKGKIGGRETGAGTKARAAMPSLSEDGISYERSDVTETPEFKRWFGDSKVVDAEGNPLVVYHGTDAIFDAFDASRRGDNTGHPGSGLGFFFSGKRGTAETYAGIAASGSYGKRDPSGSPRVVGAYLSLKNPKRYATASEFYAEADRRAGSDASWRKDLIAEGYDGIIVRDDFEEVIAFEPSQIKSVDNRGTFDPSDDRILYSAPERPTLTGLLNRTQDATGAMKTRGTADDVYDALDRLRTNMQDRMLPVLRSQIAAEKVLGRALGEDEQPYRQEALFTGRVGHQLDKLESELVSPLFEAMHENGVTLAEAESYDYAKHAPERNEYIAKINPEFAQGEGSGMTDIEAAAIIARVRKEGREEALEAVSARIQKIIDFALDTRVEAGLMSKKDAADLRARWPNYRPLRGLAEVEDGFDYGPNMGGKGITVKGPESQRAFGRRSKAEDILAHTILQAEEAIFRGEKNRVAREAYNLMKATPDSDFWKPAKIEVKRDINRETGLVETSIVTALKPGDEPYTINLKVNGVPKRIILNRNNPAARNFAAAMRRLNEPELGLRWLQTLNRTLSTLNTTLSPDFIYRNAFRDIETALANSSEFNLKGFRRDVIRDYRKALAASTRGAFGRDKDNEWGKAWQEYTANGGRVSYNEIQSIDDLRKQIDARMRKAQAKGERSAKAAGVAMWDGLKWTFKQIENANLGVENASRLAVYKNLRDRGFSAKESAFRAKEITTNFNRRGVYGVLMNSLYLFYNASTQGTARMLLSLGRSKRTRQVAAGMIVAGALNAIMNVMASPGDDDDELLYDKLSQHEKSGNLIFYIPGHDKPLKIPVAYGYNTFFEIGRHIVDVARGKETPLEAAGHWLSTAANSFNPIGDVESLANFLAPTIADPAVDLFVDNRDYADRPIMPDQPQFGPPVPDNQRYWGSVSPMFKAVTDQLAKVGGGDAVRPGVDISPETLEYVANYFTGSAGATVMRTIGAAGKVLDGDPTTNIEVNDIPVARTVIGAKPSWYDKSAYYARVQHVEEVLAQAKEYKERRDAEGLADLRRDEADVLSLARETKAAKKAMGKVRKAKNRLILAHDRGEVADDDYNARLVVIADQEKAIFVRYNKSYLATVEHPRGPE